MKFKIFLVFYVLLTGCITNQNIIQNANNQISENANQSTNDRSSPVNVEHKDALSGTWQDGGGTLIELTLKNTQLTATYPDHRGPYQGTLENETLIRMDFSPEEKDCCTGEIENDQIIWSDHTSWRKKQ